MDFVCFCGEKAKTFECKNGESIFSCGTVIDFKKMREVMKMKKSIEKDVAIQKLELGCNMKMKKDEMHFLQNELMMNELIGRSFPKCEHKLFARLGISASDQNNGRVYFSCNVKVPDIPCKFFKWLI